MHAKKLCHKFFKNASITMHKTRLKALEDAVMSLITQGALTLTQLGRNMPGDAKQKHKIKRVDRLLNNTFLYADRVNVYKASVDLLLGQAKTLTILVDWSPYLHKRIDGILRASCVFDGRSITLYEEVYQYKKVMQLATQTRFMKILKSMVPTGCEVIVVSDAGFGRPWFKLVSSLGWDFVGRLRPDIKYQDPEESWKKLDQLEQEATWRPKRYKHVAICKTNPFVVTLVTKRKNKKEKHYEFSKNPNVKQYQRQAKKAWVLATSLTSSKDRIVRIYSKRMQIETGFRDYKSNRYGLGLSLALHRTSCVIRKTIVLIIAHLALLMLFLIGFMAEQKGWQYDFQSNSTKKKRVLSFVSLGKEVIKNYIKKIMVADINCALVKIGEFAEGVV